MSAIKEQNDFFKSQYDDENSRNDLLTKRAEIYFTIISLFLTAVLFNMKDVFESIVNLHQSYLTFFLCGGLVFFAVALVLIVYSLKIRHYEGVIDIDDFIKKNSDSTQENESFFQDRVADYIVAIRRNVKINNKKAGLLLKSTFFILSGLLMTVAFVVALLILKK